MEKYQFVFHSEIIGYTSPHIGEVRKAIHRKVEKEKSAAIKNDIELHMYKVHWRYHTNRHSKGFSSTRIRPCTTNRAFSFV